MNGRSIQGEERVVRRSKAVFQKSMPGSFAARRGGTNPASSLICFLLDGFYYILSLG